MAYALREVVLEQTEKLDAVRTVEQVWTYLIGEKDGDKKDAGLLAKLFQEQVLTHAQTHKHTCTLTHCVDVLQEKTKRGMYDTYIYICTYMLRPN